MRELKGQTKGDADFKFSSYSCCQWTISEIFMAKCQHMFVAVFYVSLGDYVVIK